MPTFINVTSIDGREVLLNVNAITSIAAVVGEENGGTWIFKAFGGSNLPMQVTETFEELKAILSKE